jgi:Zn/Cd-binding protein ZinT
MTLTQTKKKQVIALFVEATIAYYIGGNWKGVFNYYANLTTGTLQHNMQRWSKATDEQFKNALAIYFEDR